MGKIVFFIAALLFGASLFMTTATIGDGNASISGLQAFYSSIKYGIAGLFNPASAAEFVTFVVALTAAGANFMFVFWALLVFSPTKIPSLRWFWWISIVFIVAAIFVGILVTLDERATLRLGYFLWFASLVLMLLAPVVSRFERKRAVALARRIKSMRRNTAAS